MMERTVLFYDFHRQYRMPRSQNVLRLGQNRSLGPTGPDNGEWRIEPVELFRVWPPVNEVQQPLQDVLTSSDTPGLQAENRLLREQVAELREERNAWREQAQRLALTDQRAHPQPTPQRGFWSRLFSRQGDSPSGEE